MLLTSCGTSYKLTNIGVFSALSSAWILELGVICEGAVERSISGLCILDRGFSPIPFFKEAIRIRNLFLL